MYYSYVMPHIYYYTQTSKWQSDPSCQHCQNLQVIIQAAPKYYCVLGPVKLIKMFEAFKTFEGELYTSMYGVCVLILCTRPLLLPRFYCQPQRGSGAMFQVCLGRDSHWSNPRR